MKATKTIEAFKEVWPLPMVTAGLVIGAGAAAAREPAVMVPPPAMRPAAVAVVKHASDDDGSLARSAGLNAARESAGEQIALGLLALAALLGIAQAFAPLAKLAPNLELFSAWAVRLIA